MWDMTWICQNVIYHLHIFSFLLFVFILPAIQMVVVCLAVDNDPKNLNFGIVNHEIPDTSSVLDTCAKMTSGGPCPQETQQILSCRYLNLLPREIVNWVCGTKNKVMSCKYGVLNLLQQCRFHTIPKKMQHTMFDKESYGGSCPSHLISLPVFTIRPY